MTMTPSRNNPYAVPQCRDSPAGLSLAEYAMIALIPIPVIVFLVVVRPGKQSQSLLAEIAVEVAFVVQVGLYWIGLVLLVWRLLL